MSKDEVTDISVVLCSYNRKQSLLGTLESLAKSKTQSDVRWEVLVVDNNSTDGTDTAVRDFVRQGHENFRYIFEPRQGKGFALNSGVRAARGRIIAFTDDDAIVSQDWLTTLVKEFEADPALRCVGGMVALHNPNDLPVTIRTSSIRQEVSWANFNLLDIPIIGCNVAFRATVFGELGPYDDRFGPGAGVVPSGADMDFIYRTCRSGMRMIYVPQAVVSHNHGRTTEAEIESLNRRYLVGRGGFYCKHVLAGDLYVTRMALREFYWIAREWFGEWRRGLPTDKPLERARLLRKGIGMFMQLRRQVPGQVSPQVIHA